MKGLRTQLSYANVVSTLCLFILLGGVAYGAAKSVLPKNSVGAKQIKVGAVGPKQIKAGAVDASRVADGSLTGADVADGSLTGTDVADGSLTGTDVADGSLATAELADGAVNSGKVLDHSVKGDDIAPDSLTGTEIDESTLSQVPSALNATQLGGKPRTGFTSSFIYKNESQIKEGESLGDGTQAIAESCETGDILLSGGAANIAPTTTLLESFPTPTTTTSWTVRVNKNGHADSFSVVVLCARQVDAPLP